jgi:DUF917 family protein
VEPRQVALQAGLTLEERSVQLARVVGLQKGSVWALRLAYKQAKVKRKKIVYDAYKARINIGKRLSAMQLAAKRIAAATRNFDSIVFIDEV